MRIHVIMPVGADPSYKKKIEVIKSAEIETDVSFHFPNYCQIKPSFDLNATLKDIENSNIVLADLSLERPSCYYELGLAQAIGKKSIYLVAEVGTQIHQACGRENVFFYREIEELKNYILRIIEKETYKKANK